MPTARREAAKAFLWAFFGGVISMAVTLHITTRQTEKTLSAMAGSMESWWASSDSWRNAASVLQHELGDMQATATVLYEPGERPSVEIAHGLFEIRPGRAFSPPAGLHPYWFIPAKVVPLAADRTGVRYYYYNRLTGQMTGPFIPEDPAGVQTSARNAGTP
jgi:hypothetical protein